MNIRLILQLVIPPLVLFSSGCTGGDNRVEGITAFEGRLLDFRLDEDGNLAIPGKFEFVRGASSWNEPGWLVSRTPEAAAAQIRSATIIPGRGYYLDDRPGRERRRERPVPDTIRFNGAVSDWSVDLEKKNPGFEDTLLAPPEFVTQAMGDKSEGPLVRVNYDGALLSRHLRAVEKKRMAKEIAGMAVILALQALKENKSVTQTGIFDTPQEQPCKSKTKVVSVEELLSLKKRNSQGNEGKPTP